MKQFSEYQQRINALTEEVRRVANQRYAPKARMAAAEISGRLALLVRAVEEPGALPKPAFQREDRLAGTKAVLAMLASSLGDVRGNDEVWPILTTLAERLDELLN
jgi:hypothetical protein